MVRMDCRATVGEVGNIDHGNIQIGKAGRKRHMGWRPTVRGTSVSQGTTSPFVYYRHFNRIYEGADVQ
ncbi:MAG: hypothetical protein IIU21_03770, partial [Schwartzia sp.]|nr:hypothetical protein [Schwartzia sp. (in: firmicutes)]